tara:strand:- start:2462 stop:3547 length:1086 start_codon:yes stop_codon:yes gene_type:complete
MKFITSILLVFFIGAIAFSQNDIEIGNTEDRKCYLEYDADGVEIKRTGYADWQCGRILGVVDCGEKLEYDQDADIFYLNNQDLVNSTGAGKPFTGVCETCHHNGSIARKINFVNGKENGIDTTMYASGCPQVIRINIHGVPSGKWLFMYDSTQYLAWEMNYYLGEKHGKHIFMRKEGDTTRWENYKNGRLDGVKRIYYNGSKIKSEITYKEGLMEGPFKVYNREGTIIEEISYSKGKRNKECNYYYDDGKPLKTENWNDGEKHGEFKTFFYGGSIQESSSYTRGLKDGWFTVYYTSGIAKNRMLYKKDVLTEEYRYDEQGRVSYSFGGKETGESEDDAMPTAKKTKKKKTKKEKTEKEKKR